MKSKMSSRIPICLILLTVFSVMFGYGKALSAELSDAAMRENAERYNRTASTVFAPLYGPLAEYIVTKYNLTGSSGTGIDIGGGPGNLVVELARRAPGIYWINADINPYFFPFTTAIAEKAAVGHCIGTLLADAQDLPLKDGTIDIAVSRGSFHLWNNRLKAFSEIYRVLKPGGTAFIGRGFSGNLPVEIARSIRDHQREQGSEPVYDIEETARELETIMKKLGIDDYTVIIPRPKGSEGIRYGIWLEFHKPGPKKTEEEIPRKEIMITRESREPVYVLEPLEVKGTITRDVIRDPLMESAGLQSAESVVSREDIEKQGAHTVTEAMEYVPGAWVESRGRKVKQFFSVRGQTYPYPDYALDGALYREFQELPSFFTSDDIERIEIMRSSAAMLTGLSGLSGVINIIPREYTGQETSWELAYGRFNSYRFHISHGGSFRNVSYALGLGTPHTDGPYGRYAAEDITNVFGNVRWKPTPRFSLSTTLFHIYGKRELARAEPPATLRLQNTYERFDPLNGTFAQVKALYLLNRSASTEFHVTYSNRDDTFLSQTDSTITSTRDWDFEWSMNLVQSLALSGRNTLRFGGFYNRWVAPYGKRFYTGRRTDLETFSAVVVDEHRFGRLDLDAGLKWMRTYMFEYGAYSIEGSAQGFGKVPPVKNTWEPSIFNGSIGAAYTLTPNLSLNANLSGGSIRPRPGTLDVNLEEPETEHRIMADAGITSRNEHAGEMSLTGFIVHQKNAIVLSGKTKEVNGRIMELYENRDREHLGVELEAHSVKLYDTARAFFSLTFIRALAKVDGSMERDREIPGVITGGGITISRKNYDLNLYLKSMSSYENDRFAASAPVPQPLGDFTTLNLTAGKSFGTRLRTRIYVEAMNLTDRRYSTVVGYPDFGRRITVGLRQVFK